MRMKVLLISLLLLSSFFLLFNSRVIPVDGVENVDLNTIDFTDNVRITNNSVPTEFLDMTYNNDGNIHISWTYKSLINDSYEKALGQNYLI